MEIRVSVIISQLFKVITLAKCFLTILELNWNQRSRNKTTKLNICHHMLSSFTQLQNRSFHVIERTKTSAKCEKMKKARAKRARLLFLVVKYANLRLFRYRRRRGCLRSLIGLLQLTITWYKIRHAGAQVHYYSRTGTSKQRQKSSFTGSGLFVLMSQCGNNNKLALQHGGVCTT